MQLLNTQPSAWRKYFLASMFVLAAAVITTIFSRGHYVPVISKVGSYLFITANAMAVGYLMRFGTLIRSRWRLVLPLLVVMYIFAAFTKIQHWPIANILALAVFALLSLFYIVWTFSKPQRKISDYLKLLWVLYWAVFNTGRFLRWPILLGFSWPILTTVLLQLAYIQFYISHHKLPAETEEAGWDIFQEQPRVSE